MSIIWHLGLDGTLLHAALDTHVLVALDDESKVGPDRSGVEIVWLVGAYSDVAVQLVYTPALLRR